MRHRHLNHEQPTLASIDDVIARGRRGDWEELRDQLLQEPELAQKIIELCAPRVGDPYAQRYHFWLNYVDYLKAKSA